MEKNLLIAFLLMGVVIFGTQYFMPQAPPTPAKKEVTQQAAPPAAPAPQPANAAVAAQPPGSAVAGTKEESYRIETDLYKVEFSNKGGVVTSWILKKYKDSKGQPLELVHGPARAKAGNPFSIQLNGREMNPNLNWYLFAASPAADGLGIDFNYSNGNTRAHKSFRFDRSKYVVDIQSDLILNGVPTPHDLAWRGGFGDHFAFNGHSLGTTVRFDKTVNKLETKTVKDASNGWSTDTGNFVFAGIQDQFFAAVAINRGGRGPVELQTTSDTFVPYSSTDQKEEPNIGMAVGGSAENQLSFYIGPKDLDILKTVDPRLEQMVDFGTWFGIVAKPLFYALNYVNTNFIHNYGWSIIVVTIIINLLTLPLKLSSMKSMQKTQLVQPELQRINEKYKGISMTDPRAAKKNEEVMELYKKHGINPAGGCLPLMLQMPFLIGFYSVLSVAIEMRQAQWFWVTDLSQPENLPIRILPVLMVATQFLLQKMTPSSGMDPQQQKIMLFMPLMFAFMFYGASSGLVLYWLTGNVFAMLQQYVFSKVKPGPVTPPSQAVVTVKKKK
ncbi:membrane protein insertase YidC [Bryobacter aggregatus]|uniref:membrane protein insertase YidC n=1 Tax=Bryobacter aggregatus TaxID=360054 RepID=UPI00138E0B66|nr:membrane protein insertase YidC [Bryobacter aggregatus]